MSWRPLLLTDGGVPWFVAVDVCRVLDLKTKNGSVSHHLDKLDTSEITLPSDSGVAIPGPGMAHAKLNLDSDERRVVKLPGIPGKGANVISESGMYKLVMRSDQRHEASALDRTQEVHAPSEADVRHSLPS